MNNNPDLKEIVKQSLIKNGFDGLWHQSGECACVVNDLFLCCENTTMIECQAGYYKNCKCGQDCEFHIEAKK